MAFIGQIYQLENPPASVFQVLHSTNSQTTHILFALWITEQWQRIERTAQFTVATMRGTERTSKQKMRGKYSCIKWMAELRKQKYYYCWAIISYALSPFFPYSIRWCCAYSAKRTNTCECTFHFFLFAVFIPFGGRLRVEQDLWHLLRIDVYI